MSTPAIDGNVLRIISRLYALKDNIALAKTQKKIAQIVSELLIGYDASAFNQGLMDLGATICRPLNPQCQNCPIVSFCKAKEIGQQKVLPISIKNIKHKELNYITGIITYQDQYLMIQNPAGLLENLYGFIQYELEKRESDYILTFSFDKELLNQESLYPFVIDPTLVNNDKKAVYDTYIYAGDEGVNRNDTDILKVGVDENGKVYRTLVKFDLPTIGTGCEVVNAVATLVSHTSEFVVQNSQYEHKRFFAHEITSAWDESTASWNNMHDKYNERVEDCFIAYKTEILGYDYFLKTTSIDVTNLVKRWYAGAANNGLLVKLEEEVKSEHSYYPFYSKNNNISEANEGVDDPKPYLIVTYRNFNGLEDYMTYQEISHQEGSSYVNHLTGNLTNVFEANKTVGGKYPIALNLVYNSNDVVLETDVGLGIGYRFNFLQTIKEVTISDNPYLEYVDGDGTIHYFYKEDDTTYLDEDGLNLKATFASEKWTIQDKSNNQSIFQ